MPNFIISRAIRLNEQYSSHPTTELSFGLQRLLLATEQRRLFTPTSPTSYQVIAVITLSFAITVLAFYSPIWNATLDTRVDTPVAHFVICPNKWRDTDSNLKETDWCCHLRQILTDRVTCHFIETFNRSYHNVPVANEALNGSYRSTLTAKSNVPLLTQTDKFVRAWINFNRRFFVIKERMSATTKTRGEKLRRLTHWHV